MGDRRSGSSRSSSVQIPWFWAALLVGCAFLGVVWRKASYRIDSLQHQLDLVSVQLQGNVQARVGGGAALGNRAIGEVQSLVEENLQSQFGFQEQAQLLLKVAAEVKALRKVQTDSSRRRASPQAPSAISGGARVQIAVGNRVEPTTPAPIVKTIPRPSCVNNPAIHYENTGQIIEECKPKPPATPDPQKGWPTKAYVLTLNMESQAMKDRQKYLGKNGIRVDSFEGVNGRDLWGSEYDYIYDEAVKQNVTYHRSPDTGALTLKDQPGFLTAGERGYRGTMRKLFGRLLLKKVTGNVLVMDDDALFDCDIWNKLKELLADQRCGSHVQSNAENGGVLLLGSAIWINGTYPERGNYCAGWKLTDADLKWAKQNGGETANPPMCFNAHRKTFGTFAVIYHSSVFQRIFDWLVEGTNPKPFDHIFPEISKAGHIVRVAYPPLAVQDVRHESQIDASRRAQHDMSWRAKMHRWGDLQKFCDPSTSKPIALD